MESAPIRSGAVRPLGRPRRAAIPVLVRIIAIAGFAFAGWIALSALGGPASAASPTTPTDNAAPAPSAPQGAPADKVESWDGLSGRVQEVGDRPLEEFGTRSGDTPGDVSDGAWEAGDRPDRVVGTWRHDLPELRGSVQEIGDDPVRYLQERRHDVFDRKDRAVHELRDLADAAGVPRVRIPDVRRTPIVGGLAAGVVDSRPVLDGGVQPPVQERPEHGRAEYASEEAAAARPGPGVTVPEALAGDAGDRDAGHCAGCQRHRHGPLLPVDQDEPWSGSAGGHQLAPVAELRSGRYPAVPPGVDPSTFHRTALTDVSAPRGPSVVPD
ncbi:hypothetical protein [Actinomadura sp. 9N215]|uniref:hypothetical protein n=1 Tax=Actinomadura sp. 9N215 TaxID=3375150 RepID=UPI0037893BC5